MKFLTVYLRFMFLLTVVSTAFFSIALSEQIEMPDGEKISFINTFTGSTSYRLAATKSAIYSSKLIGGVWTKGKLLYLSNDIRIIGATLKQGETGDIRSYAILLNYGQTVVYSYNGATETLDAPMVYGIPVTPPDYASSYSKILFADDIIVQYGYSIYRNHRDGKGWNIDTVGLAKNSVIDITLDNQGTLFGATSKGMFKFDPVKLMWVRTGEKKDSLHTNYVFGSRNGNIYIVIGSKGILVSTDHGATWISDMNGMGNSYITGFGDDMTNTVYATTGYGNSLLYRKNSNSNQWESIESGLRKCIGSEQIHITSITGEASLEIGTDFGCYTGENHGDSWTNTSLGIMAEEIYSVQFLENTTIVSTALGIFRKQDSTWSKVFPAKGLLGSYVSIHKADIAGILYVQIGATDSNGLNVGVIYSSIDQGITWVPDTIGLKKIPKSFTYIFNVDRIGKKQLVLSNGIGKAMEVYTTNPTWEVDYSWKLRKNYDYMSRLILADVLHSDFSMKNQYIGGYTYGQIHDTYIPFLYRKETSDSLWTADTSGLNDLPVSTIISDKKNTYCGTGAVNGISSIFRKNGTQWQKLPTLPTAISDIKTMAVDSLGVLYVVVGSYYDYYIGDYYERGIFATSNNGLTWQYAGLEGFRVRGLVATKDAMYAFTNHGIHKLTLNELKSGEIHFDKHEIYFGKLEVGKVKDTIIRVSNSGNDTLRVSSFKQVSGFSVIPSKFAIAPGQSLEVIVRFAPEGEYKYQGILRASSYTISDTILVSGEGLKKSETKSLMDFKSRTIVFDTIRVGEYADSLIEIGNSGKESLYVTDVTSTNPAFFCLRSSFVVYPAGKTFITLRYSPITAGIVHGYLRFVTNIGNDSILLIGSSKMATSVHENEFPPKINMKVIPNPSSEQTLVNFSLQNYSRVTLSVENILGKTVSTIFEGSLDKGEYHFPINIPNDDGTYFVRMITPQNMSTVQFAVTGR